MDTLSIVDSHHSDWRTQLQSRRLDVQEDHSVREIVQAPPLIPSPETSSEIAGLESSEHPVGSPEFFIHGLLHPIRNPSYCCLVQESLPISNSSSPQCSLTLCPDA